MKKIALSVLLIGAAAIWQSNPGSIAILLKGSSLFNSGTLVVNAALRSARAPSY